MSGETIITVIGNLTGDPELRFTPSGIAVANFSVASTPRHFNKQANEWEDGDTLFMRCAAWRQLGENVAESLARGHRVIVQGYLQMRPYETRDGEKRTSTELQVIAVGPDLSWVTAKVQRSPGQGGGGGHQQANDAWGSPQSSGGQQSSQQRPSDDPWGHQ